MRYKEFTKKLTKESALDQMIQKAGVPVAPTPKQPGLVQTAAKKISSFVAPGSAARSALDGFRAGIPSGSAMKNTNIKAPRDAQGNLITKEPQQQPTQVQRPTVQQTQQQPVQPQVKPQNDLKQAAGGMPIKSTGNPKVDAVLKQQGIQVK